MDDDVSIDQRQPHHKNPPEFVDKLLLDDLGVLSWDNLDGTENDPTLQNVRKERGYTYSDVVNCCPDKLPAYEQKIKNFYEEHIHRDEEIRYCMDGSGYFDVRDKSDRWIRIAVTKGTLIILPEGIYHRYTNDTNDYIQALRLFVGEPIWTPYNRTDISEGDDSSRKKYIFNFIENEQLAKKAKTGEAELPAGESEAVTAILESEDKNLVKEPAASAAS